MSRRALTCRAGYVPIEPYRTAIHQQLREGERAGFARVVGIPPLRWKDITSSRQKSISVADANLIAQALGRYDLWIDTENPPADTENPPTPVLSPQTSGKLGTVGANLRPNSVPTTDVSELIERADEAYKLLKFDNTVDPHDALRLVVWPPARFLEESE